MKLPRQFTDLDKHDYLEEAFERIWAVFESNASQLEAENNGISVRRVRIDAQAFAVRVFVNGKELAGGSVFIGGGSFARDQICFNYDPSAPRNSMNEWVTVEIEENRLVLRSSGMINMVSNNGRDRTFDAEGAANFLWDAIVQQLQSRLR